MNASEYTESAINLGRLYGTAMFDGPLADSPTRPATGHNPMDEELIRIYCCREGCTNSVLTDTRAEFATLPWILTRHGERSSSDFADHPSLRWGSFCSWECLRLHIDAEHAGYDKIESDGAVEQGQA